MSDPENHAQLTRDWRTVEVAARAADARIAGPTGYAGFSMGAMFGLMAIHAQRVYPVPYQWRRVGIVGGSSIAIAALGRSLHLPLAPSLVLALAYPLILLPLGFYLPAERRRLLAAGRRLVAAAR